MHTHKYIYTYILYTHIIHTHYTHTHTSPMSIIVPYGTYTNTWAELSRDNSAWAELSVGRVVCPPSISGKHFKVNIHVFTKTCVVWLTIILSGIKPCYQPLYMMIGNLGYWVLWNSFIQTVSDPPTRHLDGETLLWMCIDMSGWVKKLRSKKGVPKPQILSVMP